jgi:VWFA-related protein
MRIHILATLILAAIAGLTVTSDSAVRAQAASRERTLFVSAVDAKGEPVEGLGPDAFVVREDGRRREVLRVSRATEPMDLALLVDNSQAATDDITFIREALSKFVAGMGKEHRIALIGLAERPTVLVPYTTDRTQLATAIGRLFFMSGSGMTLMDALFETSRGLRSRDSERAVFVPVLTDGVEFTNRYSRDVVRELRDQGVSMHAVTIGRFPYADEHSIRERAFALDDGPKATGGQRITLLTPNALPATMERLARELSAQYKVVYGRPESLYEWNVDVTSGRPGLTVRGAPARREAGAAK